MFESGSFDWLALFTERGVDLAALGAAYLAFIFTCAVTAAVFYAARSKLVVSPNRSSRDYGIYVSLTLATLIVATVLENELLPAGGASLGYAAVPQIVALLGLHAAIWRRQEPWLVTLGASAAVATIAVGAVLGVGANVLGPANSAAVLTLVGLLVFLWVKAISTQRAFVKASSIYVGSKETVGAAAAPQTPWLGLTQWVALIAASVAVGVANSLLRGRGIEEIPAVEIAAQSGTLLAATAVVCAVPAVGYWLARKAWMPELTRFAWLAWIVVSFALTYGNYLNRLSQA
jgi:hypothetical protein